MGSPITSRYGEFLDRIPGYVQDTGEGNWLVADALEMEAPMPDITQAVMQLFSSRDDRRTWARAIALMRRRFGGHPLGPSEAERREGRVGDVYRKIAP